MIEPKPSKFVNQSGGVNISGGQIDVSGDIVGRDKISITITEAQQYDVHGLANPYLGLQSFTYADHAKYAGREKLIAETVARLSAPDAPLELLFVTGASGSGKSSFAQAGILPALEKHYAALNLKWAVCRPARDPIAALADALWRQLGLPAFDGQAISPADFGSLLRTHASPQQVNVIIVDQFEELFTQSASQPRDVLFNLLTHLPPFRSTRTHIIATVRADYLPELFALPTLYDIAKRGIDLRAMSVDELREAIQQPLRAAYPDNHKRFQTDLVERLAQDATEDAVYLPLLQVTLEEIWRKGTLTLGSYTNLADAIEQRADKVLMYQDYDAAQPEQPRSSDEQAAILGLCLDLVDVSLDDEARRDVRRRRSKDELAGSVPDRPRLIDALTQARLLSIDAEPGGQTRVEVDLIHETLLSNWDRLRQAIAERRHELRQRVRFEQQLSEWIGKDRSDEYLLSGVRLAEARELERRNDIALREVDATDFLHRSIELGEARRQKELDDARKLAEAEARRAESEKQRAEEQARSAMRLRRLAVYLVGALGVALVLGITAGVFGFQSNQNANTASRNAATAQAASTRAISEANIRATAEFSASVQRDEAQRQSQLSRSRELAVVAASQLDVDPERSVLIALEAANVYHTFEAEDVLRRALLTSRLRFVLRDQGADINTAEFSPDGKYIATFSSDYATQVWDAATGQELAILRGQAGWPLSAQFSPDGKYIVTAGCDKSQNPGPCTEGIARVWEVATGVEVATLRGHTNEVYSANFSSDGKSIVTTSADGTARVWEAATGKEVATLSGNAGQVNRAQFSPDGKSVVTTSADRTAQVWDISTALDAGTATVREVAVLHGNEDDVDSAQFSPDGKFIVTTSADGTARVWEAATGKEVATLRWQKDWASTAQFSPDGQYIVTTGCDKLEQFSCTEATGRVWAVTTGQEVATLHGHETDIHSAEFSPDGKSIVTASADGTARVWAVTTGREVATLRGHAGNVSSAHFSPDGKSIVTAGEDGTARVWEAATGREVATLRGHAGQVWSAQFSPDEKSIVTVGQDGTARVWEAATTELAILRGHVGKVSSAEFSPDGKSIVTASWDGTARVWDAATGQELTILRGRAGWPLSAQFSPDGKYIVTAGCDKSQNPGPCTEGIARVWEVATGAEVATLHGHTAEVHRAEFSSDGKSIVTASADGTARVWEAATGKEVATLQGPEDNIFTAQFSPDGTSIVTVGCDKRDNVGFCIEGTARVWAAATVREMATLRGPADNINTAQFSPDGQFIVTAGCDELDNRHICIEGIARVWAVATGQELATLSGYAGWIWSTQFSPDGKYIVTAGCDRSDTQGNCIEGVVRLWTATGQAVATLRGHEGWINTVQFSPDGKYIVTASDDTTARVWEVATGQAVAILRGQDRRINTAQFSPDGKYIVTASEDGTAQVYVVHIEDLVELAKKRMTRAARELTCEERVQYLHEDRVCPTPTPVATAAP